MKLLAFIILVVFSCYTTAQKEVSINDVEFMSSFFENGERVRVFYVDGTPYRMTEEGKLTLMNEFINIIGDSSLQSACLNGESFDPSIATQDADKEELYYTIVNNTDAEVVIATTSADTDGMFCSTPFRRLQSGECVKVSENDRLHTLAQVKVGEGILCGGWIDDKSFCKLGNSYEIREIGLFSHPLPTPLALAIAPRMYFTGDIDMYEMREVEAQADCQ